MNLDSLERELRMTENNVIHISYRKAATEDIPLLVMLRMHLLRDAVHENVPEKWATLEDQIRGYYEETITDETHIAYLAFDGERCVGTGGRTSLF